MKHFHACHVDVLIKTTQELAYSCSVWNALLSRQATTVSELVEGKESRPTFPRPGWRCQRDHGYFSFFLFYSRLLSRVLGSIVHLTC